MNCDGEGAQTSPQVCAGTQIQESTGCLSQISTQILEALPFLKHSSNILITESQNH